MLTKLVFFFSDEFLRRESGKSGRPFAYYIFLPFRLPILFFGKQLAESLPAEHESLRFWGKITTRGDDYIIVEGKTTEETLGEFDESTQEGVDGGNRYTYWVTRAADEEWKQLPPVTQAQISSARKVLTLVLDIEIEKSSFSRTTSKYQIIELRYFVSNAFFAL